MVLDRCDLSCNNLNDLSHLRDSQVLDHAQHATSVKSAVDSRSQARTVNSHLTQQHNQTAAKILFTASWNLGSARRPKRNNLKAWRDKN
eukprot:2051893-Rhodomonas_salina.1